MSADTDDFRHLDAAGRLTAQASRRPATLVLASVGVAVVLSWVFLLAMARQAAEMAGPGAAGPGAWLVGRLPELPLPALLDGFFRLCLAPAAAGSPLAEFGALTAMWFLMSLAMMLPTAAPMIRTYCEIADTAGAKGEPVAHPAVLVTGYLSVWLAASVGFAVLMVALRQAGAASGFPAPATGIAGAAALGFAGLYQFSALKQACLEKCRHPFAVIFARWSPKPSRIFRLGAEQGLWCVGCCWALMLVMFAVGLMNMFWMALIAVFSLVEKQTTGRLPTALSGGILLVWAAALLVTSF